MSSKQVEEIDYIRNVYYEKVEKPKPFDKKEYNFKLNLATSEVESLDTYLKSKKNSIFNNIKNNE